MSLSGSTNNNTIVLPPGIVSVSRGHSGISQYSPIHTLERQQYNLHNPKAATSTTNNNNNGILLFVQTNAACCIIGGVEQVLKSQGANNRGANHSNDFERQSSSFDDSGVASSCSDSTNPFAFISSNSGDGGGDGTTTPPSDPTPSDVFHSTGYSDVSSNKNKGNSNIGGRFFKAAVKVAAKTTASLERGMQQLVVKADSGRNPDQLVIGLYCSWSSTEEYLVTASESQPLPTGTSEQRQLGVRFTIPLVIPSSLISAAAAGGGSTTGHPGTLVMKLWIRSGATLLAASGMSKYHLLGSSPINIQAIYQQLQQQSSTNNTRRKPFLFNVPLHSPFIVDGHLFVTACMDNKYPIICSRGWSLADPISNGTNGPSSLLLYYNPPLHQAYGFPIIPSTTTKVPLLPSASVLNSSFLMTVERSTESSVVLPIAASLARLAEQASFVSLQHALYTQQVLVTYRHDTPAMIGPYVDTTLSISHFQLLDNNDTPNNNNINEYAIPSPLSSMYSISMFWQRPNSIFEVELLQPTRLPVQAGNNNNSNLDVRFYPKPLRTGILPAIYQASGGQVPSIGFFLGSIRVQINAMNTLSSSSSSGPSIRGAFQSKNPFSVSSVMAAENPFDNVCGGISDYQQQQQQQYPTQQQQQQSDLYYECYIPLETLFQQCNSDGNNHNNNATTKSFLFTSSSSTGQQQPIGHLVMNIKMEMKQQVVQQQQQGQLNPPITPVRANGGLVQLMGLDTSLLNILDGILPPLDYDEVNNETTTTTNNISSDEQRRRNQLKTMGHFMTYAYLEQHINYIRTADVNAFQQRSTEYRMTIQNNCSSSAAAATTTATNPSTSILQPHQTRTPKPFRPSSSRPDQLLSGIPFNVHIATLAIDVIKGGEEKNSPPSSSSLSSPPDGAVFANVTCGAPADHAREFGNVMAMFNNTTSNKKQQDSNDVLSSAFMQNLTSPVTLQSPVGSISGGLRRLEAKRTELIQEIFNLQTQLIMSIGNYFVEQRQQPQQCNKVVHHVSAKHTELQALRWKVFEAVQCLHHVTWICASRRVNVFSQALGIAITSYITSISDPGRIIAHHWPEIWVKYGYFICFEGLLSAVGKELGMMEDASVGIAMLRNTQVILISDDGTKQPDPNAVPVPCSPYLKWIHVQPVISSSNAPVPHQPGGPRRMKETEYIVQIGIMKSYYDQRVPLPLQHGTPVRFYPVLFEVGVDIVQWSANTGSKIMKRGGGTGGGNPFEDPTLIASSAAVADSTTAGTSSTLEDDDEDTVGVSDTDVLVQLNYEAFQKMNEYAYTIAPPQGENNNYTRTNTPHPYLASLYQHIVSSAGKMNHDILDEAATLAQQFGGGGAVFCKSGKDRTAMHVTYKQSQFINNFRRKYTSALDGTSTGAVPNTGIVDTVSASMEGSGSTTTDTTLSDANMLRIYGTRLPICEKNVGQAKYAFNSLQVKFMPDALKPPMSTLAGFLKGGKVFGGGAIES